MGNEIQLDSLVGDRWALIDIIDESSRLTHEVFMDSIQFNEDGLVPAIVQDGASGKVLMMAWMNSESLHRTLALGETVFWSRSRQELWHKGATSGNVQRVLEWRIDCDGDTLLIIVDPAGPACHTGEDSCFFRGLEVDGVVPK